MRIAEALLRLPLQFDAAALRAEVEALPSEAWRPHPNRIPGNEAVFLATTEGRLVEDLTGPMAPTEYLRASLYMMQAMAAIGAVWGRCRLMRLAPGANVPPHVDTNFYWRRHVRLHVPITTSPEVRFTCRGQTVHMAAGECWVFDTFSNHNVVNHWTQPRTHLVMDTVGGERLSEVMAAARDGAADTFVEPGAAPLADLAFEGRNEASVMSPWEVRYHVDFIAEKAEAHPALAAVMRRLDRFVAGWHGAWAQHAAAPSGHAAYRELIAGVEADLPSLGGDRIRLRNGLFVNRQISELLGALASPLAAQAAAPVRLRA